MKSAMLAGAIVTLGMGLAAPAQAGGGAPPGGGAGPDVDTNFAHELQSYGIYGPRDYNAWLGKIVCERLRAGRDPDAAASVKFITPNLSPDLTNKPGQVQAWKFLGASINTYCPEERGIYEQAAGQQG
ncbi:MAG TPA: DUF732 domain-containing protein [Mycobacterium sp.]